MIDQGFELPYRFAMALRQSHLPRNKAKQADKAKADPVPNDPLKISAPQTKTAAEAAVLLFLCTIAAINYSAATTTGFTRVTSGSGSLVSTRKTVVPCTTPSIR